MYLIPRPKEYREKEGYFKLKRETKINLSYGCDFYELDCALELQKEIKDIFGFNMSINKSISNTALKSSINLIKINGMEDEEYKLIINNQNTLKKMIKMVKLTRTDQSVRCKIFWGGK